MNVQSSLLLITEPKCKKPNCPSVNKQIKKKNNKQKTTAIQSYSGLLTRDFKKQATDILKMNKSQKHAE